MPRRRTRMPKGRAAVRHNAVTHGLRTADIIVPGELRQHWRCFHDAVVAELVPETPVEAELAAHIATLMWRLRRVSRAEASIMRAPDAPDARDAAFADSAFRLYKSLKEQLRDPDDARVPVEPAKEPPGDPEDKRTPASNLITPIDRALDRIVRYEAHLYRQLYAALERLAVLQARRRRADGSEDEWE